MYVYKKRLLLLHIHKYREYIGNMYVCTVLGKFGGDLSIYVYIICGFIYDIRLVINWWAKDWPFRNKNI